jgi:Cu(I)/Ag(I) efflux system membrane protein CusA/SilA
MDVDVFPDLNAPTVVILTESSDLAAEEVERLVSFPIETAMNGASNVRRVRSSSTNGFSVVWVEFDWDIDVREARQIVTEKLQVISNELPQGGGVPVLAPQSSILGEMMIIGLTADTTSLRDLRTIADWELSPRILALEGVSQVAVVGGEVKEYQILLHLGKMNQYGVQLEEVIQAVEQMNVNASGGVLYEYGNEYILRGVVSTNDVGLIGKNVIKKVNDVPLLLEDIAEIKIGDKSPKTGLASVSGKSAVLLTVTRQPQSDAIEVTRQIDQLLTEFQGQIHADININSNIFRQSDFIENSINNVKTSLLEGAFFVVLVLILFLMNVRTTLISLVTIPLSVLVSILVMKFMGITINTMSLGGIAIAVGALVDDAIVDVENIFKRLKENSRKPKAEQLPIIRIVFEASNEVRKPILNSTLIIIASFLPLFFLSGMEGRMLMPLGISFVISLAASTLIALTLTPVLCSYMLSKDLKQLNEPKWLNQLKSLYQNLLEKVIRNAKAVFITISLLFVAALIALITFDRDFLPPFNEGSFTINLGIKPGVSLEESDQVGRYAEELLLQIPEVKCVGRKTGRAELDEHALGINVSEIEVPYSLKDRSKAEVIADIRSKLSELSGVVVEVGAPISHRIDAMLSGTRANIAIKIFGNDLNTLFSLANKIKGEIEGIEGVVDLSVEQQVERPQIQIVPKRDVLARYGISIPQFREMIEVLLSGRVVSQVYEGNKKFDLTLRADESYRNSVEEIGNMLVDAGEAKIPLSNIATISSKSGPNMITRESVSRKVVVSANVAGKGLSGVVQDIQDRIDESINLPEGYYVEYGGQFESEKRASQTIIIISILSIFIIFMLLYKQFLRIDLSLVVLVNLPLALIGGVVSILLCGGVMNIPAIIGFISLFGIATRNGMLLVDRYEILRQRGLPLNEVVIQGSKDRLNPILMTALTSGLALLPLAINGDLPGNEIQSPMAKVILGGLFTSTFFNGFIVPIVYIWITNRNKNKVSSINSPFKI